MDDYSHALLSRPSAYPTAVVDESGVTHTYGGGLSHTYTTGVSHTAFVMHGRRVNRWTAEGRVEEGRKGLLGQDKSRPSLFF